MTASKLTRTAASDLISRIGGAAQGGSAKPPQERHSLDREHGLEQEDTPSAAEDAARRGTEGGKADGSRTDEEPSRDDQGR